LSGTALKDEFSKVDQAMQRIIGATPAFMRPPYGEYNDQVRKVAADRGQRVVNWDFDSGDSLGKSADESNRLYDQLAKSHPSTILTLNHEVYSPFLHPAPTYVELTFTLV
jgi:peptidoglycan/xylan/chitin deacetylase (PgdA/CDA1 family)